MKSVDEMCEIMQASKTKEIESRTVAGASLNYPEWTVCEKPGWNWVGFDYRVKAQEPRRFFATVYNGELGKCSFQKPEGENIEFIELTPEVKSRLGLP